MTIGEGRTAFDRLPTVVNVIELLLRSTFEYTGHSGFEPKSIESSHESIASTEESISWRSKR